MAIQRPCPNITYTNTPPGSHDGSSLPLDCIGTSWSRYMLQRLQLCDVALAGGVGDLGLARIGKAEDSCPGAL